MPDCSSDKIRLLLIHPLSFHSNTHSTIFDSVSERIGRKYFISTGFLVLESGNTREFFQHIGKYLFSTEELTKCSIIGII